MDNIREIVDLALALYDEDNTMSSERIAYMVAEVLEEFKK